MSLIERFIKICQLNLKPRDLKIKESEISLNCVWRISRQMVQVSVIMTKREDEAVRSKSQMAYLSDKCKATGTPKCGVWC